jgi:hypothetical protein
VLRVEDVDAAAVRVSVAVKHAVHLAGDTNDHDGTPP